MSTHSLYLQIDRENLSKKEREVEIWRSRRRGRKRRLRKCDEIDGIRVSGLLSFIFSLLHDEEAPEVEAAHLRGSFGSFDF